MTIFDYLKKKKKEMTIRAKIERNASVKETDAYVNGFDYAGISRDKGQFLLRYAEDKHGLLVHDGEHLDAKADLLIKYLGLVPPALATLIGYFGSVRTRPLAWWEVAGLIAGIVAWAVAICFSLWAGKPGDMTYPPTMKDLLRDAHSDRPIEMVLALKYEQSIVALKVLGNMKGKKLKWGYGLMAVSIVLLLLCLIGGSF